MAKLNEVFVIKEGQGDRIWEIIRRKAHVHPAMGNMVRFTIDGDHDMVDVYLEIKNGEIVDVWNA